MSKNPRIITTVLVTIGLLGSAAVTRAQTTEDKVIEIQIELGRLEARITALEEAAQKAAAAATSSVAAKRWTVSEIKAAVSDKTPAEVKALLGQPDQIKNTLWGYQHLIITDPDAGIDMNFLVLEFVGGHAKISQLRKG